MSGKLVGEGRFRVDRKRALEKMEKFQLEDPHRYVLEWVAAAAVSGTSRIDIYNDSDDFRISWVCEPIRGEELDSLFDHLWGEPDQPHASMLQHVGMGVLGALSLSPRFIHIDTGDPSASSPDLRLAIKDPQETKHAPLQVREVDGVRCHVREQINSTTVREALTAAFSPPKETHLIYGAARLCPIPIFINGRRVPPPELPHTVILDVQRDEEPRGRLWITVERCPPVEILRHGLTVGHHAVQIGPFSVGGYIYADQLRLNASRSSIVADERWKEVEGRLASAIDALLSQKISTALREGGDPEIVWHGTGDRAKLRYRASRKELLLRLAAYAIARLGERGHPIGPDLEALEILTDSGGRPWSLAALSQQKRPYGVCAEHVHDPELEHIVFTGYHAEILKKARPNVEDLAALLEQRAEGRRQRARAAQSAEDPIFPRTTRQHTHRDGALSLAIKARTDRLSEARAGSIRISVRVGRLPLCTTEIEGPGGKLDAILDNPAFTADLAFREVVRDEVWQGAVGILRREALSFLRQEIAARAESAPTEALELLTDMLVRASRKGQRLEEIAVDERLRDIPVIASGTSRLTLRALASGTKDSPWWLIERLPPGCPPDLARRVLLVPNDLKRRWLDWLSGAALDGERVLPDRIERERRLAKPRKRPVLSAPAPKIAVRAKNLTGELAKIHGDSWIEVLKDGVEICTLNPTFSLPGIAGIVDGSDLALNEAYSALQRPDELLSRLVPFVDELAVASWDRSDEDRPPPDAILSWLAQRYDQLDALPLAQGAVPFDQRPLARRFDGKPLTIAQLRALAQKKRPQKLRVLSRAPGELPGFSDAVQGHPKLGALLDRIAPGRWRDATADLEEAERALGAFLASPLWVEPPNIGRIAITGDGYKGIAVLPVGPELGSAKITVLWRGRALTTRAIPSKIGPWIFISGDLFSPNRTFTDLAAPRELDPVEKRAGELLEQILGASIPGSLPDPAAADSWLQLAVRLSGSTALEPLAARLRAIPLLRSLSGPLSIDEVALRSARGRVLRVTDRTPDGPTDEALYLREQPALSAVALSLLHREIPLADDALARWRKGQLRKARLTRKAPVVETDLPVLARAKLPKGGEVALLGSGSGLAVQPLVEGLPLTNLFFDLPVPALAVIEGDGVRADAEFERCEESAALTARLKEVREAVDKLVRERLSDLDSGSTSLLWAASWVLHAPTGLSALRIRHSAELKAPIFPLADGTRASLAELLARRDRDGMLTILASPQPIPRGVQPLIVTPALRVLLGKHFQLLDLSERLSQRVPERPQRPEIPVAPPRRGAISVGQGGITVFTSGIRVRVLQETGPLPLTGFIEDDALTPNALWSDVLYDEPWRALLQVVDSTSRAELLARVKRDIEPEMTLAALPALAPNAQALLDAGPDALLSAIREASILPDTAGGLRSIEELLSHPEIRAVLPGSRGDWLEGRPPFVILTPEQRSWLSAVRKVRDAQSDLAKETAQIAFLRSPPWPAPEPPRAARRKKQGDAEIVLWLAAPGAPPPKELRALRAQGDLDVGVPGLSGWINLPLDATPSARKALDRPIEAMISELLAEEARTPEGRAQAAQRAIAAVRGRELKDLVAKPFWRDLVLLVDVEGQPVSLSALLDAARQKGHLLYDKPGTRAEGAPLVLAAGEIELQWLEALLPSIDLREHSEVERRRAARELGKARAGERKQLRKELLASLRELLREHPELMLAKGESAVDEWLDQEAITELKEPKRSLFAWLIASRMLSEAGETRAELAVIGRLAERLSTEERAGTSHSR